MPVPLPEKSLLLHLSSRNCPFCAGCHVLRWAGVWACWGRCCSVRLQSVQHEPPAWSLQSREGPGARFPRSERPAPPQACLPGVAPDNGRWSCRWGHVGGVGPALGPISLQLSPALLHFSPRIFLCFVRIANVVLTVECDVSLP